MGSIFLEYCTQCILINYIIKKEKQENVCISAAVFTETKVLAHLENLLFSTKYNETFIILVRCLYAGNFLSLITFICLLFNQLFLEENTKTYKMSPKTQETTASERKVIINLFKEENLYSTIANIISSIVVLQLEV